MFATMEDPYLRERESDVADVAGRLRMNLRRGGGGPRELLSEIDGPAVLIADELTASVAAQLDWSRVQGFATDAGSRTYHTAILARSLKVPAVVGLHDARRRVAAGHAGDPRRHHRRGRSSTPTPDDDRRGAAPRAPTAARAPRRRGAATPSPAVDQPTASRIRLEANIELLEDLPALARSRRRRRRAVPLGVHARRPRRSSSSTEDEQVDDLSRACSSRWRRGRSRSAPSTSTSGRPAAMEPRRERRDARPGLRGLRLGLANPAVLRTQLRALVRAAPRTARCASCSRS